MRQVVPSVFALKDNEYAKRFHDACMLSRRVHIDVMDGHFVSAVSPPLSAIQPSMPNEIEVHLMARKPEKYIDELKRIGAKRAYVHIEIDNPNDLIQTISKIKASGIEVHAAINPETNSDELIPLSFHVNGCLIMAVRPGKEGQPFIPGTFRKIREVARILQGKEIAIDGGVTREIAAQLKETPVNVIVAGSSIFRSGNADKAINHLREAFV